MNNAETTSSQASGPPGGAASGVAPTRNPTGQPGRWRRAWDFQALLWRHCFRRMRQHNALAMAAALTYQTIFALVPAIVIAFLVMKAAGVVEDSKRSLHELLSAAGLTPITVPDSKEPQAAGPAPAPASAPSPASAPASSPTGEERFNAAEKIEEAVASVESKLTFSRLGPVGLVLLAWSAITLLTTIERSLNQILEAPRSRPLVKRVLLYWSTITFLPIVLVAGGYLATKAVQTAESTFLRGLVVVLVDLVGNLSVGVFLMACVYKFLPNTPVSWRSALSGAAVVVPMWIAAKWGFALYVSQVAGKSLYGGLGLLPLFLMWINLCWYGFLAGAELVYTSANLRRLVAAERSATMLVGPMEMLAAALAVAGAYARGEGPARFATITEKLELPDEIVRRLIGRLAAAGVVCPVASEEEDSYVPGRPADSIRVREVMDLTTGMPEGKKLPAGTKPPSGAATPAVDPQLARAVQSVKDRTHQALGEITLADLLRETDSPAQAGVPGKSRDGS